MIFIFNDLAKRYLTVNISIRWGPNSLNSNWAHGLCSIMLYIDADSNRRDSFRISLISSKNPVDHHVARYFSKVSFCWLQTDKSFFQSIICSFVPSLSILTRYHSRWGLLTAGFQIKSINQLDTDFIMSSNWYHAVFRHEATCCAPRW